MAPGFGYQLSFLLGFDLVLPLPRAPLPPSSRLLKRISVIPAPKMLAPSPAPPSTEAALDYEHSAHCIALLFPIALQL